MADEVVEAADGLEALQRISGRCIELAITDARMPRLDGRELGRVLAGRHIPVLLLNGNHTVEAGVAVLEKPFDRQQLLAAIDEALLHRD